MIVLIPARGGSKSIPRKNLVQLAGRPLISYAIRAGLASTEVSQVVVSTEDAEIAELATKLGAAVLSRDPELASDSTTMIGVLMNAMRFSSENEALVLVQPTNPFVRAEHINNCASVLANEPQWNSVQTVAAVMHNDHYINQRAIKESGAVDFILPEAHAATPLKQQKPPAFRFGGCVAMRVGAMRQQVSCFPQPSQPILIDPQLQ